MLASLNKPGHTRAPSCTPRATSTTWARQSGLLREHSTVYRHAEGVWSRQAGIPGECLGFRCCAAQLDGGGGPPLASPRRPRPATAFDRPAADRRSGRGLPGHRWRFSPRDTPAVTARSVVDGVLASGDALITGQLICVTAGHSYRPRYQPQPAEQYPQPGCAGFARDQHPGNRSRRELWHVYDSQVTDEALERAQKLTAHFGSYCLTSRCSSFEMILCTSAGE